jgi:hypothetical protein
MALPLRELQARLAAAILGGKLETVAGLVRHDRLSPVERLRIYHNHTLTSLATALGDNFPVVRRLVGDEFFRAMAKRFVAAEPPGDPCLSAYGAGFAAFLEGFGPARSLPYLPDVARIEWLRIEVTFAPEVPPLDLAALAALPEAGQRALPLALRPTVRLLESRYPVERIWLANQQDEVPPVDLAQGPSRLLIRRNPEGCRIEPLATGPFAFFEAASFGATLEAAAEAALGADPQFDLAQALAMHRMLGLLADTIDGAGRPGGNGNGTA